VPGITTGALACAFLQMAYNEIGVARVKYISQSLKDSMPTSRRDLHPYTFDHQPTELPQSILERVMTFLGLRKLSDEEYIKTLKKSRDGYMKQIRRLERETKQEQQRQEK